MRFEKMSPRKTALILLLALCSPLSILAQGWSSAPLRDPLSSRPVNRLNDRIDDDQRVVLVGNRHPQATPENLLGDVVPTQRLEHMVLVLQPDASQAAALGELVRAQQDPASPYFHKWLTPESFGQLFGVSENDLTRIANWLEGHQMQVEEIPASHGAIIFSGTAAQVESAFHTQIKNYRVNGETHFANATDPEIPQALAPVVRGVVSMHDFRSHAAHSTPAYTLSSSQHYLAPADWATIYDVNALYSQGFTGSGESIAVVGRVDVLLSDVRAFRSNFGLPANDPQIIVNGADPGDSSYGDQVESSLDVEWAGAIASHATVKFVTSASGASDGIVLSSQYAVNHNVAPIITVSYGLCEAQLGSAGNAFWNSLWTQAAAQGQSVFVASGDSGAAGCDASSERTATQGRGVNGMCTSPNSTCVGGTEFNDANSSLYWASSNGIGQGSALSYIPEVVWNESSTLGDLAASGGGVSIVYSKPSWQSALGVPSDGMRDVPDVAMAAATHDAYLLQVQGATLCVGGTSAATPSFAGVVALLLQQSGSAQGNINPALYRLAAQQFSANGAAIFHSITSGNNTVPGVTGFSAATGYDQATGLGSVDGFILVNNWNEQSGPAPSFSLSTNPSSLTILQGASSTATLSLGAQNGFNSTAKLSASGAPSGVTISFSSTNASASAPVTVTVKVAATAPGSYTLTLSGSSGALTQNASLTLVIPTPSFTLTSSSTTATVVAGSSTSLSLTTAVQNGFKSALTLSVSGLPTGLTATFSPASIASPGAGTTTMALSATSGATIGNASLTVKVTGGGISQTQSISLTVAPAPTFAISSSVTSVSIVAGHMAPVTLSVTPQAGFQSSISFSVSGLPKGVTATFSPSSIAAPGRGTTTLNLTAASTATAATATVTITASGGGVIKTQPIALTVTTH
jgi:pseudomonalisin